MPKGVRKSRNPVEKLQEIVSQLQNVTEAILNEAAKPDFPASVAQLKARSREKESKKIRLSKEACEVSKLLQTFPGLSKQVLAALKSKIAEYQLLGVLEKYKVEQPASKAAS
jgi:hypothetical protein